jgi:AcrR family transcriptional regulator
VNPRSDRQSTDDRIIRAALALISRDGLGGVTMRGVAETAGIARQTLYNHYPDVDTIVAEAIRRHNRESIQLLESSLRVVDEPAAKVEQLVRHVVAVGSHAHHAPGIGHALSADARAIVHEYNEALDRSIREILEQGQRAGVLRDDLSLDLDTALVRHMLHGLAEQSAQTPDRAAAIATAGTRTVRAALTSR